MTYPTDCANITDFAWFVTNVMAVPTNALASPVVSDPNVITAFAVAMDTVSKWLQWNPYAGSLYYNLAVYNFAADYLINWAIDPMCVTFWEDARKKLNITGFVGGIVSSTADESTSTSLDVSEKTADMTMFDLQLMKTPYGRAYLAIAQKIGTVWGLS
jgi:hypothetical protein